MILLDTDVAIDVLREYSPAVQWWGSIDPTIPAAVPGYVALELVDGCRDSIELAATMSFLRPLQMIWINSAESDKALLRYAEIRLANGLDPVDMLIAQTAIALGVPLQTFNERHFKAVPGLRLEKPYRR